MRVFCVFPPSGVECVVSVRSYVLVNWTGIGLCGSAVAVVIGQQISRPDAFLWCESEFLNCWNKGNISQLFQLLLHTT
jgi:hypothetical protein